MNIDDCLQSSIPAARFTRLIRITSDEPDDDTGDGSSCNDIVIFSDSTFAVRAERNGAGDGRVYSALIVFQEALNAPEIPVVFKLEVRACLKSLRGLV